MADDLIADDDGATILPDGLDDKRHQVGEFVQRDGLHAPTTLRRDCRHGPGRINAQRGRHPCLQPRHLPGHKVTHISHRGFQTSHAACDAFGNAGHRGTDIPAPEGTPILAAHSGTVLVSGWNDSYGNQVLLDNGAGLSTRYAHMTQTAVTAGEAVTAGQVIGYVGSTGDSTGNHLHFEVMQNGVRMNPLELVFGQ